MPGGDLWVKMRLDLEENPKVGRMADLLETSKFEVMGMLQAAWSWGCRFAPEGHAPQMSHRRLDEKIVPGFCDAMIAVGWIDPTKEGVYFPEFAKWNFTMRKDAEEARRLKERNKKAAQRAKRKNVPPVPSEEGGTGGDTSAVPLSPEVEGTRRDTTTPHYKNRDGDGNTPATPSGGSEGVAGPRAKKTTGRGEVILAECDDPERAAIARRVVKHYQAKVRTTHLPGGAVVLLMNLLAAGLDEGELCRRCDRYGAHCDKNETMYRMRQGAGTFFSEKGHHANFSDEAAKDSEPTGFRMPPRPASKLRLPPNDPRNAPPAGPEAKAG